MFNEQVIYHWHDELKGYYLAKVINGNYEFVKPLEKLNLDTVSDPLERQQIKKMIEMKSRMSESEWF